MLHLGLTYFIYNSALVIDPPNEIDLYTIK